MAPFAPLTDVDLRVDAHCRPFSWLAGGLGAARRRLQERLDEQRPPEPLDLGGATTRQGRGEGVPHGEDRMLDGGQR